MIFYIKSAILIQTTLRYSSPNLIKVKDTGHEDVGHVVLGHPLADVFVQALRQHTTEMRRTSPSDVGARDLPLEGAAVCVSIESVNEHVFDFIVDDGAQLHWVMRYDGLEDDLVQEHHVLPVLTVADLVHLRQLSLFVRFLLKYCPICAIK
jgi:hypothetical protein